MIDTFFDGLDELYHHAEFWEDCATRAGCRCENVMFVFFLFVTIRVGCTLNSYCVAVNRSIFILFSPFFRSDCPFRTARQFLLPSLGGATIFEKLQSKIAKKTDKIASFYRSDSHFRYARKFAFPIYQMVPQFSLHCGRKL